MKFVERIADFNCKIIRNYHRTKKTVLLKPKSFEIPKLYKANFLNESSRRPSSGRRLVLIDGNNVASSQSSNSNFSVERLELCYNELAKSNDVVAIVPQFRLKQQYSSNNRRLQELEKIGQVLITPGKTLNGQIRTCNPNAILLDIAKEFTAAIVSNGDFETEKKLDRGMH